MKSIKLTTLLAAFAAAFITTSHAETKTWDGGANTTVWGDANNWNPDGVPGQADSVEIDGVSVTHNGNLVVSSVKLTGGATVTASGELKSEGNAVEPVYNGGVVSCTLLALITGPVTISDAEIKNSGTGHANGFYQAGSHYLNFVDGAKRGAAYTFNANLGNDPYSLFVNRTNPLIRYKGEAMSKADFDDNFEFKNNGDGTITLYMRASTGWHVGSPAVENIATVSEGKKSATVSAVATKVVETAPDAPYCYVAFDTVDHGSDFANWPAATRAEATLSDGVISASIEFNSGVTYYARVFASYTMGDVTEIASSSAVEFRTADVDYGDLTNVYEYIGTDNDLTKVSNWMLDGNPAALVPTEGTDIRWFGSRGNYAKGSFKAYSNDRFVGTTMGIDGDFEAWGDISFSNSTINARMIVLKNGDITVNLYGSTVYVLRTDAGQFGFYDKSYAKMINFISGKASSYTGRNSFNATDKASVYSSLIENGKVVLDGATINASTWADNFVVSIADGRVTISYDPAVVANVLGATSVSNIKDTSATASVEVQKIETGAVLKFAYGTTEPTDSELIADGDYEAAVADSVASRGMTGLTKGATYYYRFGIMRTSDNSIVASAGGSFVAKEFDAVYRNGAWEDNVSVPLNVGANRILFASDYDAGEAEMASPNKVVDGAKLTMNTLVIGYSPTLLHNGWIFATRPGDLGAAPYSLHPPYADKFIDFVHDAPANGVVYRASCYSFRYEAEGWVRPTDETIYDYLFGSGKFLVNGERVSSGSAIGMIALTDDTANSRIYLHTVDDASLIAGSSAWTFQPGARVKLSKKENIASVAIPDATDVSINLNGNILRIGNLTVGGEKVSGTFTSTDLPYLSGSGTLIAGGNGLAIVIR